MTAASARRDAVPSTVGVLLVLAALLLPAWGNRGPATTSLVDVILVPLVLWGVFDSCRRMQLPHASYLVPTLLLVLAGLLAGAVSAYPGQSVKTLATDLYLLLVALTVTRVVSAPGPWARRASVGWVAGATAWTAPLLLSAAGVVPTAAWGVLMTSEDRALGTFANPNLAGSYYCISLFVVLAVVERAWLRRLLVVPLLVAVALTGSMAAFIGTGLGAAVLLVRRLLRGLRPSAPDRVRTAAGLLTASLVAVLGIAVAGPALATVPAALSGTPVLDNSIGRLDRSDSSRLLLWSLGFRTFEGDVVVGVGPGTAGVELAKVSEQGKSLHSDLLASLLERGLLGAAALLLLLGATLVTAWRVAVRGAAGLACPAALAVAVLSVLPGLVTHEVLHFRHVWMLLGLLAATRIASTPARLRS
jgi:O-antigen ligase